MSYVQVKQILQNCSKLLEQTNRNLLEVVEQMQQDQSVKQDVQ